VKYISIIFPTSPTPFTYEVDFEVAVGDLIAASLRNKTANGIVNAFVDKPDYKTKAVKEIVRKGVMSEWMVEIANWIMQYYASHAGKTFRLWIPERVWKNNPLKRESKIPKITAVKQAEKKLNKAQTAALKKIEKSEKPVLLHGITGSGKTEIYLKIIQKVLNEGKQAILLIPEIALTPQLVGYFAASIPSEKIAVIHSNLAEGVRLNTWERIHSGEVKLVIGSRSALFSPTQNLGVIILDESHEGSYKNDQTPRYHARGVALEIAKRNGVKLILGSATPSVESYTAAKSERIELVELPQRVNDYPLPEVKIVDLRNELKKENYSMFSEALQEKIHEKLEKKQQIILLLNKRGYNSAVVCRDCGEVLTCRDCSLPLTYHQINQRCICHACGYFENPPSVCPNCKSDKIRFLGSGTQKLESEISKLFPAAKVIRADRDTTSLRGSHQRIYETFRSGEADILVGTQIVAKGLDLPNVSLVGVLLADIGLHLPDFRAGEKTFSLLTQVAGRSGRGETLGEVIIQTYTPTHPALLAASKHDYQRFYNQEIAERKSMGWPPFSRIAKFTFVDMVEKTAKMEAQKFAKQLKNLGERNVFVSPAMYVKMHNKFHWNVIWKGSNPITLLKKITIPDGCRVDIDSNTLG
jgi:primosomal protein N' (replication factor Y)